MIELGESVRGTLSDDNSRLTYTFGGTDGDTIYVAAFPLTPQFEVEARLFNDTGALVASFNDTPNNELLGPVILPVTGNYTVEVIRPDYIAGDGDFALLVDRLTLNPMAMDTPVSGRLEHIGSLDMYTIEAEEGELFAFYLTGRAMGITFVAPSGFNYVIESFYDDPAGLLQAFPESGVHRILVQTVAEGGSDYALEVQSLETMPLALGETITGEIQESEARLFSFEASAGKMLQLNAELPPGGVEMQVHLLEDRAIWETLQARDEGSGPNGNPRIEPFVVPEDGTYYVILAYDDFSSEDVLVDYTITLSSSSLVSLAPGIEATGSVSPETGTTSFAYRGSAGERIQVTLTRLSEEGAAGLNIFSPDDEVLAFFGRGVISSRFEIEFPLDGMYQFVVSNFDYDLSTMDFSLLIDVKE